MEEVKTCSKCSAEKSRDEFPKKHGRICRECRNETQREKRKLTKDLDTKRYEKSLKGYLMRTYRNMLSRVSGVQKKKAHLYEGLEILDKEDFYKWSLENEDYLALFKSWEDSGYEARLSPSIDRQDSTKGYSLDNIRWITHSLNSSLGNQSRFKKRRENA